MERTIGLRAALISLVLLVSACGVDAPPVPPGQDNPETVQSVEDINPSAYF